MKPCCFGLLKKSPLFKGLSDAEMMDVAVFAKEERIAKSGHFFRQDEAAERVFVLTHGKVKITQVSPEGSQVLFRVIAPGELFGISAGFGEERYPASAFSEAPATAWSWESKTLLSLMERFPKIAINSLGILSKRVQEIQERFREVATERVEKRVARVLIRLAAKAGVKEADGVLIDLKLSRQDLAEMTGTTVFTVSRLLTQWEKEGIVTSARQRVKITIPHALTQIAEEIPHLPTARAKSSPSLRQRKER